MTVPMYCLFLAAVCFTIWAAAGLLKLIDDTKVGGDGSCPRGQTSDEPSHTDITRRNVFIDGLAWCAGCHRATTRGWPHANGCPSVPYDQEAERAS